ncbi:MAG: HD domain-containing phosphohydrolase [Nocardioidaceae bacterium]
MRPTDDGVRIAELVATLSYAADLGLGQPMEHSMRRMVIALRLADRVGAGEADREATYYLGLLTGAYCHADAAEQASWFGDDISFKADAFDLLGMDTAQVIAFLLRRVGSHGSGVDRARRMASLPITGRRQIGQFLTTHAAVGAQMVQRMGLREDVRRAVAETYEQWDGKGQPRHLAGERIALAARLVPVAGAVEIFGRRRGVDAAVAVARRHRGTQYDPRVVDAFCAHPDEVLAGLEETGWDAVLDIEPQPRHRVEGAGLDTALEAMADAVDLKSPHLTGHSRGVANLAAAAGRAAGLGEEDVRTLRRAGLIHDLGRLGVSNAVWDKPGPLTEAEWERVRLHPYLTDRMMARVTALGACRGIAAKHHERLDGSGYPRGLTAASLGREDRLLAAADAYHAMTEPRPYRTPLSPGTAARRLEDEVRAGRLDEPAVNAVLRAAGHRAPARSGRPHGLTPREVEVLRLLARGHSNREIARVLTTTPKTASNHIEHIYAKLGVRSRAQATLFATQHGLVGSFESADVGLPAGRGRPAR